MPRAAVLQTAPAAIAPDPIRRVYVIDDHPEIRRSLHALLATSGITTWPFASGADFLDQLSTLVPAPILLDIRMPEMGGIELLEKLGAAGIDWPVIVMTAHGEVSVAVSAMKLGAIEFLEKPFESEALEVPLERAFAALSQTGIAASRDLEARRRFERLTPREAEVVRALMGGSPNKNVAHLLSLSARTVEMHRANALAKLGVRSVAEVVALARDAAFEPHRPTGA